jgi:DNA-binding protein HU-beta
MNEKVAKHVTTRASLITAVADSSGIKKADVERVYDSLFETMKSSLVSGSQINFPGFGILSVTKRSARDGRNPATGEKIRINESFSVKFKMSSLLKKLLND